MMLLILEADSSAQKLRLLYRQVKTFVKRCAPSASARFWGYSDFIGQTSVAETGM